MASYRSGDGGTIELGRVLSQGGEGFIHEVPAMPTVVAKIWREPDERQARKLDVLLRHAPVLPDHVRARVELAWPSEVLYDEHNVARGYLMPRVPTEQYHELVRYCIPAARRGLEQERGSAFTKTELLTIARNVAEVFRILHVMGYLIGDVNHTNFLVRDDGKVFVIDLDSIQARDPDTGEVHRCTVGKEDFTPPRLMGQRFEDVDRTPDDDMFGLAVLAFQLLMDGNHPFDPVDQTGEEGQVRQSNIRRAHSPYTAIDPVQARAILDLDMIADTDVRDRTRQNMLALMGVEATADFSTVIGPRISLWLQLESEFQDMFRRSFEGRGGGRPLSSEWVQALENAGATILQPTVVSPPPPAAPSPAVRPAAPTQPVQPAPQPTQPAAQPQTRPGGRPATQPQIRPGGRPATPAQPSQPAAQTPARPTTTRPTSQPQTRPGGKPATQPSASQVGSPPGGPPSQPPSTSQGGGRRRSGWWFYLGIPLGLALLAGLGAFTLFYEEISDMFEPPRDPLVIRVPLLATPTAVITATPTRTPKVVRIVIPAPTSTPTPTPTVAPTLTPTTTPTPTVTPTPTASGPETHAVTVAEGEHIEYVFDWDHDKYGDALIPTIYQDGMSIWTSPVSHSELQATIVIGADIDSIVEDLSARIEISDASATRRHVINVTVRDAGESASIPTVAPTPIPTPTATPRPTTTPRLIATPRSTWTPRPIATPRPTATSIPTNALLPASQVVFGPANGSIEHDPDDGFVDTYTARGVKPADAIIEARFYNPYSSAESDWNSGFLFRNTQANWFHAVIVTASGRWLHILSLGDEDRATIGSGFSPRIDTSANGSNLIRVVAVGSKGSLYVNGHHVADLNLGDFTEAGDVEAVGEYFTGSGIMGKSTRFEDFTVRAFLEDVPPPIATPTIVPAVNPTITPVATPTPTAALLPQLRLSLTGRIAYHNGVLTVPFEVVNEGNAASEPSTLRLYIDGRGSGHGSGSEYEGYDYEMKPLLAATSIPALRVGEWHSDPSWNVELEDDDVGQVILIAMAHNCQLKPNWSCAENRLKWEYQQAGNQCAGPNGVGKYASGRGDGWSDDWQNKEYLSECANVDVYGGWVALAPTPTPEPTPSPTPTPRPTPVSTPTPTPIPTQTPRPTPAGASVGVTVTISWDMFDANEPNNAIFNIGLCDPSDCRREWLRDSSGTEVFLTWRSDDGQMSIPVPPGSYTAKVEVFTGDRTSRCTTDFEVTSGLDVVTTREDCNKAQYGQELKVR